MNIPFGDRQLNFWCLLLLALVFLLAFAPYWVITFLRFPDHYPEIGILFGHGDLQYIPSIVALARGDLSPTYSSLFTGEGVMLPPFFALALHGVTFALLGVWGFVISEAIFTFFLLGAVYILLKRFKLRSWAIFIGIWLLCFAGDLGNLLLLDSPLGSLAPYLDIVQIYGKRYVRPLLSQPMLVVYLILLYDLWRAPRARIRSLKFALLLGAWSSLLLQAHAFDFIGLWLAPLAILALRGHLLGRLTTIGPFVGAAAVSFAVVSIPFLLQMGSISDDLRERGGFFGANDLSHRLRLTMFVLQNQTRVLMVVSVLAPLLLSLGIRDGSSKLRYLSLISAAAIFGPVLYTLGTPSFVQNYHFMDNAQLIAGIVLLFSGLIALDSLARTLARFHWWQAWEGRLGWSMVGVLGLLCGLATVSVSAKFVETGGGRQDLLPNAARETLKADWAEIAGLVAAREASRREKTNTPLLLTNDPIMFDWWVLNEYGNLLMPDVATVVLPSKHIEYQLVQAGKILGWSTEEWVDFFNVPSTPFRGGVLTNGPNHWFLGHNKYHAFREHAFSDLEDYPLEYRQRIREEPSSWQIILPISEQERLRKLYESISLDSRAIPDYVVWAKRREESVRADPGGQYDKWLENDNYVLWKKL